MDLRTMLLRGIGELLDGGDLTFQFVCLCTAECCSRGLSSTGCAVLSWRVFIAPSLQRAAAQLRQALRNSSEGPIKARARLAIRSLSVAALGSDDHARLVLTNQAACQLTGYSESELLRLGVPEITAISDEAHTDVLWQAFLRTGQQSGKYDIRRKDGSTITVEYLAIANVAPGIHVSLLQPLPA
jgi:PAS domain S-box-containing protein